MSHPGTTYAPTEDCRECGGEFDPAILSGGLCPTCDADAYVRNLL